MKIQAPEIIRLQDYEAFPFSFEKVNLHFKLDPFETVVESEISVLPLDGGNKPLVLDGEMIALRSVYVDEMALSPSAYQLNDKRLVLSDLPQRRFTLKIVSTCAPSKNTALSGLYMSNGMYCTQCEAEGFRRITFYPDRPDVMSRFTVRVEAPLSLPILLSNGNPVSTGKLADGQRHYAEWDDPHPKPCYLFALVAGDLASVHQPFTTSEGRAVTLGIYVEKGKEDRCAWAMESLKASMRWDEQRFARTYDLDVFNIVAVSDFNMGAMENKGLNIFNDKYILALPETATDTDFERIEAIIAHEYFHNWTGDRITCRDWFQLCLKEGLTVFRDQEFTSDLRSRAVKRIDDVQDLRARQFPEDQGPLSHPVRPSRYIEINNFYTATVYEKGAELCRMMLTLIGSAAFDKAMQLYFKRHDGEAATVEDFVACMAEASGRDFKQFFRWYEQAGTPNISARGKYDAQAQTYELSLKQSTVRRKGEAKKLPFHIPLRFGLLDSLGNETGVSNSLIELREERQTFTFKNIKERPTLSINRDFSAPINIKTNQTKSDLIFLMAHDADSFNRWEAAQVLAKGLIEKTYLAMKSGKALPAPKQFSIALANVLNDGKLDDGFKAKMLQFPAEEEIVELLAKDVDADLVETARNDVRRRVATNLHGSLREVIIATADLQPYKPDLAGTTRRALYFSALELLGLVQPDEAMAIAEAAFSNATNMTMEFGVLSCAVRIGHRGAANMLDKFYQRHAADPLLIDKWFMVQALNGKAEVVRALLTHKDFTYKTPNRVYALVRNFMGGNLSGFNSADGMGYRLGADVIIALNAINPQVASRLATSFRSWRMFDVGRRAIAQAEMQRILAVPQLSRDVFEIISRTLQV